MNSIAIASLPCNIDQNSKCLFSIVKVYHLCICADVKETVTKAEVSGSNNASSEDKLPNTSPPSEEEFKLQNSPFDFSAMSGILNVCFVVHNY